MADVRTWLATLGWSARSTRSLRLVRTDAYRDVAEAAWAWVLDHVRELDGPWLPESVTHDWEAGGPAADRDSLYAGLAGLAPILAEIALLRPLTDAERLLALRIVERLSAIAANEDRGLSVRRAGW